MNRSALKLNGAWACVDCHASLGLPRFGNRRVRPPLRCWDCGSLHRLQMNWLSGRMTASYRVALAIKAGAMERPARFKCTDCDKQAECYDHRDYGLPLAVDPVCRSCNVRRGSAKPLNPWLVSALVLANRAQLEA